ncbi:MAG: substrate-specific activator of APC-dependent proteolysis [Watsoniomyces obsoletus]|nr:MAG: substrate-specific activator of APC-dependent proteolysis [Watsoniomyces obsoletus]
MPAMSPTMTEGNIASWKVKEGDSFSTGDVLLEIETDKAQMDVEAQDDGVLAKIIQKDGAKSVKVGSRIAVLAEPDDDLSTLEIPAEDSSSISSPQEEMSSGVSTSTSSESAAEGPPTSKPSTATPSYTPKSKESGQSESGSDSITTTPKNPNRPFYPSVQHLLKEHNVSESNVDKIPPSGPNGRILKGDVLAYLGTIQASYPSELSARVSKLGHLDLSNITPVTPPSKTTSTDNAVQPSNKTSSSQESATEPQSTTIALPISLEAVQKVQSRIRRVLGIDLPLSTFIARASDIANHDLPSGKASLRGEDELFNQILGLDKISSSSKTSTSTTTGNYWPEISALSPKIPTTTSSSGRSEDKRDIYDILTSSSSSSSSSSAYKNMINQQQSSIYPGSGPEAGLREGMSEERNLLTVNLDSGTPSEKRRARTFLGRVKMILEVEPGRLIL